MPNVVDFRASRRASAAARRSAPPMPRFDRIPRPSASKMLRESARLLSFSKGWPRSSPVRPADLARAGLYRMGFSDLVACFRCGGMMHRWEEGDDPAREHARHFPACARAAPLPQATQDGPDSALCPEMRSFGARIRSFASWPYTANVSPHELAYAGFYYSGHGDLVRCFSCDGHLQEWALGDSAWHEHAKWFPRLRYRVRRRRVQPRRLSTQRHRLRSFWTSWKSGCPARCAWSARCPRCSCRADTWPRAATAPSP
ncbi:baculoviral IAP repeat-containing protein 3-like [Petromyzon marinus]|uniref:baculoviral IAP repeat-containing protein 3-like n=1 Tax=Petromyzon marinus TaxID=7757 RepID=UPI003F727829